MKQLFLLLLFSINLFAQSQDRIKIAVLPFNGLSAPQNNFFADVFTGEFSKLKKYSVLTRADAGIQAVLNNYNIEAAMGDKNIIKNIGQALKADYIIVGSVLPGDKSYWFNINVIDVATLENITGEYRIVNNINDFAAYIAPVVKSIHATLSGEEAPKPAEIAQATVQTEHILKKYSTDVLGSHAPITLMDINTYKRLGANASIKNESWTLLTWAIFNGLGDLAEALIKEGAHTETPNKSGLSPLHLAAAGGDIFLAQLLLQNKANPNSTNKSGATPLHFAVQNIQTNMIKTLLENGADLYASNNFGNTPLHTAAFKDSTVDSTLFLIENGADINVRVPAGKDNAEGTTPLMIAVQENQPQMIQLLLQKGANPNAATISGWTPLHFAASEGLSDSALLLLEHGALINTPNSFGNTPLHTATFKNSNTNIIFTLIQKGADINTPIPSGKRNTAGTTPLMIAAEKGQIELVQFLLDNGAQVDKKDITGRTALQRAESEGQKKSIELLLLFSHNKTESTKDSL